MSRKRVRHMAGEEIAHKVAVKTTVQEISDDLTNEDWEDITGLVLTFTPETVNDKFTVRADINGGCSPAEALFLRTVRIVDSVETAVGVGTGTGSAVPISSDIYPDASDECDNAGWEFEDSPNTLDDVQYKVQAVSAGYTTEKGYINRPYLATADNSHGRTISNLTVTQRAG